MRPAVRIVTLAVVLVIDAVLLLGVVRKEPPSDLGFDVGSNPSAPATSAISQPTGRVGLTLSGGNIVLRTMKGSCTGTGRPVLTISRDFGGSFNEVALPTIDDLVVSTLLWVKSASATELAIIATGADCKAQAFATSDGGAEWNKVLRPADSWYVGPDGRTIVSPERSTDPGCAVASLSTTSAINARVLCSDGRVNGTNDAGTTWVTLGKLADARAATFFGLRGGFAVAPAAGCASQVYSTGDAGGNWSPLGCIDEKATVALLSGKAARLVASDEKVVWISTDGGAKWDIAVPSVDGEE